MERKIFKRKLKLFCGKWKPTRIEYGDNWYLVGIPRRGFERLRVRFNGRQ